MIHPAWVSASFDGRDPVTGEPFAERGHWGEAWLSLRIESYIKALARVFDALNGGDE